MDIGIFDLETSGLYANSSIILCAAIKAYNVPSVKVIRADKFASWSKGKSDNRDVVEAIMKELSKYDMLVAHNGQYFDKAFLNSACIKYGLEPKIRFVKFYDPVMTARRHMRIARNSLTSLIDYLDIPDQKTPIRFEHWLKASLDGDKKSMDYICEHCVKDIKALEAVYRKTIKLNKTIDDMGSSR